MFISLLMSQELKKIIKEGKLKKKFLLLSLFLLLFFFFLNIKHEFKKKKKSLKLSAKMNCEISEAEGPHVGFLGSTSFRYDSRLSDTAFPPF